MRHYDDIGLLKPSRTGNNGYRYYGQDALVRLQRILLLRDLGLGLPAIADVLGNEADAEQALGLHLEWLQQEQDRLGRQIAAVRHTIEALQEGGKIMAEKMFDGFDHTKYREEVQQRWGKDAYATGRRLVARHGDRGEGCLGGTVPAARRGLDGRGSSRASRPTARRRRTWPGATSNGSGTSRDPGGTVADTSTATSTATGTDAGRRTPRRTSRAT